MDNNKTWYEEYPELVKFKDDPVEKLPSRIRRNAHSRLLLMLDREIGGATDSRVRGGTTRPTR